MFCCEVANWPCCNQGDKNVNSGLVCFTTRQSGYFVAEQELTDEKETTRRKSGYFVAGNTDILSPKTRIFQRLGHRSQAWRGNLPLDGTRFVLRRRQGIRYILVISPRTKHLAADNRCDDAMTGRG